MKKLKLESKRVTEQGWAINNFIFSIFALEVSAPANLEIAPAKSLPANGGRHRQGVGRTERDARAAELQLCAQAR